MRRFFALVLLAALLAGCADGTAGSRQPTAEGPAVGRAATVDAGDVTLPAPSVRSLTATPVVPDSSPTRVVTSTLTPGPTPTPLGGPPPAFAPPPAAVRLGDGPLQLALVTGLGGADDAPPSRALAAWGAVAGDGQVPAEVTLWLVPDLNPHGVATGSRLNESGIDPGRNADDAEDGCALSNWSQEDGGGPYPFAAPETATAARFLQSMSMVVFLEYGPRALALADACRQHPSSVALAERLRDGLGVPLAPAGARSGHLADYLAGLGVAAATLQTPDSPEPGRLADLLLSARNAVPAAEAGTAAFLPVSEQNSRVWRFPAYTFTHPLALEVAGERAYLLDAGRVLEVPLDGTGAVRQLLAPGVDVDGVRVLEPLDLALAGRDLLVLDRAGDVYRYALDVGTWAVEWYDRPVRDVSSQFYVAVTADAASRYLLEASYQYLQQYVPGADQALWLTADAFAVDADGGPAGVYVMTRRVGGDDEVELTQYVDGVARGIGVDVPLRQPGPLRQPRQLRQTPAELLILDQAGYRLQAFDLESGRRTRLWTTVPRQPLGAFWSDGQRLILAGRDTLIFVGESGEVPPPIWPDALRMERPLTDPDLLFGLQGLRMPAPGSGIPIRPIRLPGAPRHYRLGVHAGLDLYWQPGTPIRAVADGQVIQADIDYVPPAPAEYVYWREESNRLGYTSDAAAEFYRGREIRIRHDDGTISGYAHLSAIAPGIVEGVRVAAGDVIGEVGNSGSPAALDSPDSDAHIHVELWWDDQYLGFGLRPIETWEWLRRIYRNY